MAVMMLKIAKIVIFVQKLLTAKIVIDVIHANH